MMTVKEEQMAKDDYFKIMYVILKELYETMKAGERFDKKSISPERLGINDGYLLSILEELLDNGFIKGLAIGNSKTGKYVSDLNDMRITMKGVQFLEENSMMRKVAEALKDVKDIVPGL